MVVAYKRPYFGTSKKQFSTLWDGGFAGISESGIETLKSAIKKYCDDIESHISEFDENGNIENAFKGQIQENAREYIVAMKEYLQAYVSTMRQNLADVDKAYENYKTGTQEVSKDVATHADSIRQDAQNIRVD